MTLVATRVDRDPGDGKLFQKLFDWLACIGE